MFQALLSAAVDGIIVIDALGSIQIINPACERLFGYTPEEIVGHNVNVLMPSPYREQHDEYLRHYRQTGERRIIGIGREVMGQRKDGSTFPMYLSVGQAKVEGKDIYVGIIRDLTERVRDERRLQEVQAELLHVSRLSAMGQMGSALAHELNQPLTAIMNYCKAAIRTLEQTGDDPRNAKVLQLVGKAVDQTARAGNIIKNLRSFVEKREASRRPEDLATVIDEAVALGQIGSADANVRVKVELDRNMPDVLVDKVQIQQVLINLIRNGIEAMQAMPTRLLSVRSARIDTNFAQVTIADTGPGLPKEVAERLFQPFITTKENGMGIGLTICQTIVEAHGGRIWVEPNPGGGVAFHFQLPLSAQYAEARVK